LPPGDDEDFPRNAVGKSVDQLRREWKNAEKKGVDGYIDQLLRTHAGITHSQLKKETGYTDVGKEAGRKHRSKIKRETGKTKQQLFTIARESQISYREAVEAHRRARQAPAAGGDQPAMPAGSQDHTQRGPDAGFGEAGPSETGVEW